MNPVTISIITTVYQAEQNLPRLLDSMMTQKCEYLEFYLIDNAATDKSGVICEEYALKDERFTVCHLEENIGYIRARNYGIEHCNGTYVGFCDSDDYLEPGGYDKVYQEICESNCDFWLGSYCTESKVSSVITKPPFISGEYHSQEIQDKMLLSFFGRLGNNRVFPGFVWKNIYRRSILMEQEIRFLEELKPYEDQLFNLRFVKESECVYCSKALVYHYSIHSESITAKLLSNYDPSAEWKRVEMLVAEKGKLAETDAQKRAVCNEGYDFLYGIVLNISKQKKRSIAGRSKDLKKLCAESNCKAILNEATETQGPVNTVIRKALHFGQYGALIFGMQIALKIREAVKNENTGQVTKQ